MLLTDPQDVTVEANEWAQFNCTVHCNYTVNWYMAGHSSAIKRNNTVPGLLIKRGRASSCTESNKEPIFLWFLPLRHSISQHFTVLQMRDPNTVACADVPVEDVTADQLSSQVALFGMMHFCFGTFF